MRTSFVGRMGAMSIRYDDNTKARAVRLVREHRDDYESGHRPVRQIGQPARHEVPAAGVGGHGAPRVRTASGGCRWRADRREAQ